jgi:hypothetical protein
MASNDGVRRLYLHVGLPKSGTTFLQALMSHNRDRLLEQGVLYPSPRTASMFHAAIEVRGTHDFWGFPAEKVAGSWESLVKAARAHEGTTVISHEIFSGATPEDVARVAADLEGFEVHVVVSARDVVRQVTAMWQEGVKNGDHRTFEQFGAQVTRDLDSGDYGRRFWSMQELTEVLERWSGVAPRDRMHVVTAPRSSSDPLELWRRYAEVFGVDPTTLDSDVSKSNESLGVAQIALLRDVNVSLDGRIKQPQYSHVVKRLLAQRILPRHRTPRPQLPPSLYPSLRDLSDRWVKQLRESPVHVYGSLDDLLPEPPDPGAAHPDDVSEAESYAVAREVIADLLVEVARLRRQNANLTRSTLRSRVKRALSRLR